MNDVPEFEADDEPQGENALSEEERASLDRDNGLGVIVIIAAIIPFGLITFVLAQIFGDIIWKLTPILFVGGGLGLRLLIHYNHRMESGRPWHIPGHGSFTGAEKKRHLRNGSIVVFIVTMVTVFGYISVR